MTRVTVRDTCQRAQAGSVGKAGSGGQAGSGQSWQWGTGRVRAELAVATAGLSQYPGAHPGFSQGEGARIFFLHTLWPLRCEISTLRKLITVLQASSVLPHSKKPKKLQRCI